jgi:hypothetical protein
VHYGKALDYGRDTRTSTHAHVEPIVGVDSGEILSASHMAQLPDRSPSPHPPLQLKLIVRRAPVVAAVGGYSHSVVAVDARRPAIYCRNPDIGTRAAAKFFVHSAFAVRRD